MVLDNLPHTAVISRRQYKSDDLGAQIEDDDLVLFSDLPCWCQSERQMRAIEFQKRTAVITHKVYFTNAAVLDLEAGDRLTISGFPFEGTVLNVISAADITTGAGIAFKVICEKERSRV